MAAAPLPAFLLPLRATIAQWAALDAEAFAMALINEYRPGSPIGWHRDAPQYDICLRGSTTSACEGFRTHACQGFRTQLEESSGSFCNDGLSAPSWALPFRRCFVFLHAVDKQSRCPGVPNCGRSNLRSEAQRHAAGKCRGVNTLGTCAPFRSGSPT